MGNNTNLSLQKFTSQGKMMKFFFVIYTLVALSFTSAFASSQKYIVSVVPQLQTTDIQKTWGSFLRELSKQTGFEFEIKHYATIPLFEKGLENGEPDIAFMNPYHAVMAYEWNKYEPIIHDKESLVGILVVKENSSIKELSELNNTTLAFPAPNAFAASLYMRALLEQEEHVTFTPIYVKTHSNVYRNVLFGKYPAGGGVNNTLMREAPSVTAQLRTLYTTAPTAPHPLCIHPRVSDKTKLIIKNAILKMGEDSKFKDLLNDIQIPNPVHADYNSEYLKLQKLNLKNYIATEN